MALVYNLDTFSRKSHRHGTSDRRRTTTNYNKYGYEVATLGSSSIANGKESVMHVLRVQPGVVVNYIEPPSSSSRNRNRSWTTPRIVEYKSSHKNTHSHVGEDPGDPSWTMTPSPHSRPLELVDGRNPLNSFGQPSLPRDLRRSPTTHHFIPDEHFPRMPYPETYHMEPPYPEPHYPVESHEPPRHVPSPIDIPIRTHSFDHSDFSLHSPKSSDSDLSRHNHGHSGEPYYFDPRQSPVSIEMPNQISPSPRSRRHSFDFHSQGKPPSPLSSNARTVRFRDDPVLPSPPARRKGWWNRKGEQLWDNHGSYAAVPEHDEYPSDLRNYPEAGTGWMNEDGVQIDMKRRLVRKKPLRSALKKSSL